MVNTNTYLSTVSFSLLPNWDVKFLYSKKTEFSRDIPLVLFGTFLSTDGIKKIKIEDDKEYKILGVRSYGKGAYINRIVKGNTLKMRTYLQYESDSLFWCKVDTKNGAFGIIDDSLVEGVASTNMTFAKIDTTKAMPAYIQLLFASTRINSYMDNYVTGTTNRKYIRPNQLLTEIFIPLHPLEEQRKIVEAYNSKIQLAEQQEEKALILEKEIESYLFEELGIKKQVKQKREKGLSFVLFKDLNEWGYDKLNLIDNDSLKYPLVSLDTKKDIYIDLFRGKSPKYDINSNSIILNQRCNRWNDIELEHARKVKEKWLQNINKDAFTQKGDILINSTGEGTIGRASCIAKENHTGLLYDSHILLLRFDQKQIIPLFFTFLFNSSFGQNQVDSIKSAQSTKQTELGINNLKKIQFPIPSLEVQNKITNHITNLKGQIKTLLQQAEQNRKQAIEEFENIIFD